MKQKELIEYHVIHVDSDRDQADFLGDFTALNPLPQAIELRGDKLVLLGKAFIFWYGRVAEITYRQRTSGKAMVLFSRLSSEEYFRPADVIDSLMWPDTELDTFTKQQQEDRETEIVLQLNQAKAKETPLVSFLREIYSKAPQKKRVVIEGEASPYLFLLALDWFFSGKSEAIFYHDESIV